MAFDHGRIQFQKRSEDVRIAHGLHAASLCLLSTGLQSSFRLHRLAYVFIGFAGHHLFFFPKIFGKIVFPKIFQHGARAGLFGCSTAFSTCFNLTISSFSLSVSVLCVFFALLYRFSKADDYCFYNILGIAAISFTGLYLRYEFLYILLISGGVLLYLRRINADKILLICFFAFVCYLPWMLRNYVAIGKFTYATSLNYNFAKGYSQKYDLFSTYNFPYSPKTDEILPVEILYKKFRSEKEIDEYLSGLNKDFMRSEPALFLKLTLQKSAVNLAQYFPDYEWISKYRLYIFYSIFFIVFQILLVTALFKIKNRQHRYLFVYTLSLYLFTLIFYAVAPMPRYFLLYVPFFSVVIARIFFWPVNNSNN